MAMALRDIHRKRVSSERPVNGLSEHGNEAFDLLAPLREVDGAVSYGVFLRISESIHGAQASNCFHVPRALAGERRARCPGRRKGPTELRERSLLLGLISRSNAGCFNSFDQLQGADRTASMR